MLNFEIEVFHFFLSRAPLTLMPSRRKMNLNVWPSPTVNSVSLCCIIKNKIIDTGKNCSVYCWLPEQSGLGSRLR